MCWLECAMIACGTVCERVRGWGMSARVCGGRCDTSCSDFAIIIIIIETSNPNSDRICFFLVCMSLKNSKLTANVVGTVRPCCCSIWSSCRLGRSAEISESTPFIDQSGNPIPRLRRVSGVSPSRVWSKPRLRRSHRRPWRKEWTARSSGGRLAVDAAGEFVLWALLGRGWGVNETDKRS